MRLFACPTQNHHAIWKQNMLEFLALYPVVFFYDVLVNEPFIKGHIPFWLNLFLSCTISVTLLGSILVPILIKLFHWWLDSDTLYKTFLGTVLVLVCYCCAMYLVSQNIALKMT